MNLFNQRVQILHVPGPTTYLDVGNIQWYPVKPLIWTCWWGIKLSYQPVSSPPLSRATRVVNFFPEYSKYFFIEMNNLLAVYFISINYSGHMPLTLIFFFFCGVGGCLMYSYIRRVVWTQHMVWFILTDERHLHISSSVLSRILR